MKRLKSIIIGGLAVAIIGTVGFRMFFIESIEAGTVGIVYAPSTGIQEDLLTAGWHIVSPLKKVTQYSIATEQLYLSSDKKEGSKEDDSFQARCSDGVITVDFEMSYAFDQDYIPTLFQKYRKMSGKDIMENIIRGKIKTYVNEVTSNFTVLEAHMEKKTELNQKLFEHISVKLKEFGIVVESANISNTTVAPEIEAAITERSKAAQELEAEKQKNEKAKVEAERKKTEAEAAKEVKLIEAQAQAEANKLLQENLTTEMLQKMYIEKWNGVLPSVQGGNGQGFILNLPSTN